MMCLDVLRAMRKEPACRDAFIDELRRHQSANSQFDQYVDQLAARLNRESDRRLGEPARWLRECSCH